MARQSGQKLKLIHLQEILRRETDEEHPLTLRQIQDLLEQKGVSAERKSLYDDIEQLRLLGEDIVAVRDTTVRYYVGERPLFFSWLSGFGTDIRMIAPGESKRVMPFSPMGADVGRPGIPCITELE